MGISARHAHRGRRQSSGQKQGSRRRKRQFPPKSYRRAPYALADPRAIRSILGSRTRGGTKSSYGTSARYSPQFFPARPCVAR